MTRSKQQQITKDDVICGIWTVVDEAPTRGPKGLMWTIVCPLNHKVQAEHNSLSYGIVPTCGQCAQATIAAAIEARRYEKSVLRASSFEVTEQGRQRRISQAAQDEQQLKEGTHGETN